MVFAPATRGNAFEAAHDFGTMEDASMMRRLGAGVMGVLVGAATIVGALGAATPAYAAKSFGGVDQPSVSGWFVVGSTLTAKRDTKTSPKATTVTYRWTRDGKAISKETKSKYKLTKADQGKQVAVKVCYKKKKYKTTCLASSATTVAPPMTMSQSQALRMAQSYLSSQAFSRSGLIEQLVYEGFSTDDATFAADHVGANWTAQAVRMAKSYLSSQAFSRSGLIEQLVYEGFSTDDATYGADQAGANWSEQAIRMAREYLESQAFFRSGLIEQLVYEGFSASDAAAAADAVGLF